jgi:hypothetical protein
MSPDENELINIEIKRPPNSKLAYLSFDAGISISRRFILVEAWVGYIKR